MLATMNFLAVLMAVVVVISLLANNASALSSSSTGPHITDLNVLLPPRMTNPVYYRLLGTGGCFSWSWDHHDILLVQPEYDGSSQCSKSARLTSIAPYSGRKETAVYAADLHSGAVIRCEVFIDKVSRIQIFHHSIKLDLDGLATLHIRAFDDEDNVFSSLVGLQFMWQLMPKPYEADNVTHHLVHVPLKDTPLTDCAGFCGDLDTQIKLENSGVGSDLYVVKGIEIGHEIVTAQLLEPQFDHVTDKIVLTVAEAMSLDPPSPVFTMIGAKIQYRLVIIRHNTPQAIDLPSHHHRWSILNSTVAQVESTMGSVIALNLGTTSVIVEDTRVAGHMQISTMHVVVPAKLCLYIIPVTVSFDHLEGIRDSASPVWYIVSGQQYVVNVKVFSAEPDGNEIQITENNDLKLEGNTSKYWDTLEVANDVVFKRGWRNSIFLKAHSQGQGTLTSSLTYRRGELERKEVLKVVQEVIVCNKVKVMNDKDEYLQIIHLPWAPGVYQEVELKATGGCARTSKDYGWFSADVGTVSIIASGVIRANRPGRVTVKVVSVFDVLNYDEVIVEVTVPSSMVMLPDLSEAVVGTNFEAAVALKTSKGDYYYKCDAFSSSVRWKFLSGSEFFKVANSTKKARAFDIQPHLDKSEPLHSSSCAWAYLYASGPGRAILHATFSSEMLSSDEPLDGQIILQVSAIVAAYTPLVILEAGNGNQFGGYWVDFVSAQDVIRDSVTESLEELYLVPGTGIDILLVGGPERWNQDVEYLETVDIIGEEGRALADEVLVKQATTSGVRLYRVSCQSVGNFKLVFSRGNLAGDDHPLPAVASVGLSLICSFPSTITLIANERANTHIVIKSSMKADRGLGKIRTSPVIVANGCTIRLAAVGIHISGRPFANSSSLCLRWQLSGCEGLAHWNGNFTMERSSTTWERFLVLHDASGLCTVRATVIGFLESMASSHLNEAYLHLESVENALTDALRLQLVSSLRIVPEYSLLVFHPEAKVNISITGGTCFLEAVMNDTQVAEIIRPPTSAQCSWMILGAKGLGTAAITVYDIGLSPPVSVSGLLTVAVVDWIKIISQEEISLMQGTTKALELLAGTQDGSVFDSSQFVYMDIHVHCENGILELVSNDGASSIGDSRVFGPTLLVKAEKLGLATLYVSARKQSGLEIPSQVIKVEVFAPLRIHPDYVFLVPGASYMLGVKGGPTIGVVVEYLSKDNEFATINRSSGKLSAVSIGNTTVRAAVHENGQTLICEAYARVEVGIPSVMILNLQSRRLCVGCQMPIFPSCVEGDLFSFYEVCKDYSWSVEDEKVLSFQTPKSLYPDVDEVPASSGIEKYYASDSNDKDHGFINIISGRSGGRTKVSVSFSCDFVSSGSRQPVSYNASESLSVVSEPPLALGVPITWVLPPFYTTSDILPDSAESYGQSYSHQSKRTVVYSLLKSCEKTLARPDPIVIAGTKIKTMESNNIACIQAKELTGRTVIASCVKVAEVAQVRLTTKDFLSHVVYLSLNDRIELNVGYCDDLGYPFFEAHDAVSLDAETNYHDIIAIHLPTGDKSRNDGRGIIHIQARSQGSALVKIFINHDGRKAVYILVSVGAQIFPRNPAIHAGKFLNFSLIGDGMSNELPGRWLSTNVTVIFIDGISGEAHALNEGVTEVLFDGSNLKLRTNVTVLKVDLILVTAPEETLTNVPFPAKGYKFSVRFSDPQDATGTSTKVPYVCRVDPPFVGYAKPWTDHITDTSYCLFFPYSPKHLASSISKFKTTREQLKSSGNEGFIHISIIAFLRDAQDVMGSTHALFVGGFSVSETDKLNLTQNSNKARIMLSGNTDVEIQWSAKDKLMIRPLQKVDLGIGGSLEFEVEILSGRSFTDKIIIMLPITGQTSELDVSYDIAETSTTTRTRGVIWAAVFISAVLLILTIVIFLRFLDRPSSSRPSRQSSPPLTSVRGPVTPDRTADHTQSSPRTPQPFLEYVRKTVDETPYYKREGRRRFDPQYTY